MGNFNLMKVLNAKRNWIETWIIDIWTFCQVKYQLDIKPDKGSSFSQDFRTSEDNNSTTDQTPRKNAQSCQFTFMKL